MALDAQAAIAAASDAARAIVFDPILSECLNALTSLVTSIAAATTANATAATLTALCASVTFAQVAGSVTGWWSWTDRLWSCV